MLGQQLEVAPRLLGPLPLADILHQGGEVERLSAAVAHHRDTGADPDQIPVLTDIAFRQDPLRDFSGDHGPSSVRGHPPGRPDE